MTAQISFDNSYARLPDRFFVRQDAVPVAAPSLIRINQPLASRLGIDPVSMGTDAMIAALAGNGTPDNAEPLAMAYAGHQFGGWNPQLGDGRALLLGEVVAPDGARFDLQLKGSGRTPFSRGGDGRAPLGAVLREYVVSEAMAAFGVPTTRALAAVATGEPVYRECALPGAVLTRVAASHIRVGTFQYFAARKDEEALRLLADHVIARHYPEAADAESPYVSLLFRIVSRQATLIAKWMGLGFIHGVMNTDNMAVSGETIDFGPCAFMDDYHPMKVFSSIDQHSRYAFDNQPKIAQWNLVALAQALLTIFPGDQEKQVAAAQAAIDTFAIKFHAAWMVEMRAKLAIEGEEEGDEALIHGLLTEMEAAKADFTLTFRGLSDGTARDQFSDPTGYDQWARDWRARGADEGRLNAANPRYIPRNHRVEAVIAAAEGGDFGPFHEFVDVLAAPYDEQPDMAKYTLPPKADEIVHQTFCGT